MMSRDEIFSKLNSIFDCYKNAHSNIEYVDFVNKKTEFKTSVRASLMVQDCNVIDALISGEIDNEQYQNILANNAATRNAIMRDIDDTIMQFEHMVWG